MPHPAAESPALYPDRAALAAAGERVRERLAADAMVYRLPGGAAEVFALADFLSADECTRMMGLVDRTARPSSVYEGGNGATYRTSYSGDVDPAEPFVKMIERRICDLLGLDPAWGETVQGQRYQPGQEFRLHYDWFNPAASYWPRERQRGGQRSWTAMAWLNAVEEGGETEFPMLETGFPPQPGTLLIWNNALPDGTPNRDTLHAARPVIRGVKYVITKWFRTRPWG